MAFPRPLLLLFLALGLAAGARADTQQYSYTPLASLSLPALPAYTLDQQKFLIGQARLLLVDMYAHLQLKIETFCRPDETHCSADPKWKLDAFDKDLSALQGPMDQTAFHDRMMKIFVDERDLHTIYIRPLPYACYASALPFSLNVVKDSRGDEHIAISKVTTTAGMVSNSPAAALAQIAVGDVIETYNGVDPVSRLHAIDEDPGVTMTEIGAGANTNARRRRAVEKLTYLSQAYDPFPTKTTVDLTIRKRDGTLIPNVITFPWIAIEKQPCDGASPPHGGSGSGRSTEQYEREYEALYRAHQEPSVPGADPQLDLSSPIQTDESILHYKVLVRKDPGKPDHSFGYLRLDSFEPTLDYETVLTMIQSLLTDKFSGTDGVIIDLRNNGGGEISFGEEMIQLFAPNSVEAEGFRMHASEANKDLMTAAGFIGGFLTLVEDALSSPAHPFYTATAPLTDHPNNRGQSYFKPVAILTNSSCFSTCDMFTAGMQDNGGGAVWAEDQNTGGGGANNWHYTDFASMVPGSTTFTPLPDGQDMGIAWRQTVRVGKNAGVLIEDTGVLGDHGKKLTKNGQVRFEIPASSDDLALNSLLTVRKITDSLIADSPAYSSVALDFSGETFDFRADQKPLLTATVTSTSRVDFLLEAPTGEQKLGSQAIVDSPEPSSVTLALPLPASATARIALQGYEGDKPAWRKVFIYRRIPAPTTAPVTLDLSTPPTGLGFFTLDSDPSLGWIIKNGQLQIGPGPTYADNLAAEASLFVTIPSGLSPKLNFTATIDTEKGYDFFRVYAVSEGVPSLFAEYDGKLSGSYSFNLEKYAGQTIEIRFEFTSDPATEASGVFLKDISVK